MSNVRIKLQIGLLVSLQVAPASPDLAQIVPSARAVAERSEAVAIDRQQGMSWAQRLKRVFAIDIPQGTFS